MIYKAYNVELWSDSEKLFLRNKEGSGYGLF